tara:strand:- start:2492 stop:3166 length:675 start_codon:yes stop_codon:yes gene_type:complete
MLISKDKRILIYLFLLILFGSINNKYFTDISFFKIKNTKLVGLNDAEKSNLLTEFEIIKKKNIFFLQKKELIKILNSNDLIESFLINKNYPSDIIINIKKTNFLANINILDENFLIGSNKRLIKSKLSDPNLPTVLGNPSLKDFFLINDEILKSSIKLTDIKKLYFFPSKRWDLELNSGILIKLPMSNPINSINKYFEIKSLPQFNDIEIFDMRVENQIIVNES